MSGTFHATFLQSQIACAQIEAMGMAAENEKRRMAGESPAYGEEQFNALIDRYGIGHNSAITALQRDL